MLVRSKYTSLFCAAQQCRYFAVGNNIQLVKDLRSQTGAPVGDVKAALEEADWDLSQAFVLLRKKGLAAAQKKQSRIALQGQIGVAKGEGCVALVELNCETDFVAKNDSFYSLLPKIAQVALNVQPLQSSNTIDIEDLKANQISSDSASSSVADSILEVATNVRENVKLRRAYKLVSQDGVVCSYVHNAVQPGFPAGQIATALSFELNYGGGGADDLSSKKQMVADLGNKLCMHIAAFNPIALDIESVPQQVVEQEKAINMEKARSEGKPENMLEKIAEGRLKKYFDENVLLEQKYVMDDSKKVREVVKEIGEEIGSPNIKLSEFLYVKCGENVVEENDSQ